MTRLTLQTAEEKFHFQKSQWKQGQFSLAYIWSAKEMRADIEVFICILLTFPFFAR